MNCGFLQYQRYYYFWDEFPTVEPLSRVSSIGLMEYNDPTTFEKEYRFHLLIFKPKPEYLEEDALVGTNGRLPRTFIPWTIQYLGNLNFGYHQICMNDRVNNGHWAKFDDLAIDDFFRVLGEKKILVGQDITGKLASQLKGLLHNPKISKIAQMRLEASLWLETLESQNDPDKRALMEKITKVSINGRFDFLTSGQLNEWVNGNGHFGNKFTDLFKPIAARFKLYKGCAGDFARLEDAQKQIDSITYLLMRTPIQTWAGIRSFPREIAEMIASFLNPCDMPRLQSMPRLQKKRQHDVV